MAQEQQEQCYDNGLLYELVYETSVMTQVIRSQCITRTKQYNKILLPERDTLHSLAWSQCESTHFCSAHTSSGPYPSSPTDRLRTVPLLPY